FEISSRNARGWTTHATGTIRNHVEVSAEAPGTLDQLRSRCSETVDVADLYENLRARGLEYGPSFRASTSVWRCDGEAIAQLHLPETDTRHAYRIHPVLMDAAFQLLAAALPQTADQSTYVPVSLAQLRVYRALDADTWAYVRVKDMTADVCLLAG